MKTKHSQILISLLASCSLIPHGQTSAWVMIAIPALRKNKDDLILDSDQIGWIASIPGIFVIIGAIISKYLMDSIGRRNTLIISMIPAISAYTIIEFNTFESMIIGRILMGIGGGFTSTLSIYYGEISNSNNRGYLNFMAAFVGNFVSLIVLFSSAFLTLSTLHTSFIISNIIILFILHLIPETPHFHIMKGHPNNAEKVLHLFHETEQVQNELLKIQNYVAEKKIKKNGLTEILKNYGNRKALFINILFIFYLQFSGTTAIKSYAGILFEESGLLLNENLQMFISQIIVVIATCITTLSVDKLGRRLLLLISSIIMIIALSMLSIFYNFKEQNYNVNNYSWIPLLSLMLLNASKYAGSRPLASVIISEYYPLNIKSTASVIVSCICSLSAALSIKLFQVITDSFGFGPILLINLIISIIGATLLYIIMPETKNLSLMEIEKLFEKSKKLEKIRNL